jgi:hypothetical protein
MRLWGACIRASRKRNINKRSNTRSRKIYQYEKVCNIEEVTVKMKKQKYK